MNKRYFEETLSFYNENAEEFTRTTKDVEFSEIQEKFLQYLQDGAYILDFGCGSGRDSKAFLEKGYRVHSIDGSKELCEIATKLTGQMVEQKLFQEFDEVNQYDGVWACSSILHLTRDDLVDVLVRIKRALKENGYLYTSFKYGDFEGVRHGRYFINMTEESFGQLICEVGGFEVADLTITADVRPGREEEKWLNVILKKNDTQ